MSACVIKVGGLVEQLASAIEDLIGADDQRFAMALRDLPCFQFGQGLGDHKRRRRLTNQGSLYFGLIHICRYNPMGNASGTQKLRPRRAGRRQDDRRSRQLI